MPVSSTRLGETVIYRITGAFDPSTAHQYHDLNAADYNEIGDALGAVIDFREMTSVTVSGLRAAQSRLQGIVFDTPVAFVGSADSIIITFLRGVESLTSRGRTRFGFFTDLDEAVAWIDSWYTTHHKDRDSLHGLVTTHIPPRKSDFNPS
jgi:hypothetical protein